MSADLRALIGDALNDSPTDHIVTVTAADELADHLTVRLAPAFAAGDLRAAVEALRDGIAAQRELILSEFGMPLNLPRIDLDLVEQRLTRALLATPAPEAAKGCTCPPSFMRQQSHHPGCPRFSQPGCGSSGNYPPPPAPDLPTTVQADGDVVIDFPGLIEVVEDRDAGQVRLSEADEEALAHALGMCTFREDPDDGSMCMCGLPALGHDEAVGRMMRRDFPAVFAVIDRIAARQSDPAATERVEWGVRSHTGYISNKTPVEIIAREIAAEVDSWTLVRRTVTAGEWTEVGE